MSTLSIRIVGLLIVASMLLFPAGALAAPGASGETVHVVQWGETLSLIANRYGVTVKSIMSTNGLHDPNFVYVGQRLTIPAPSGPPQGGRHVVAPGETLTSIAFRYGTTVGALASANGLSNTDLIYVGQVLNVPDGRAPGPRPPGGTCANNYTVRWGDTLSGIAWHHGTTVNALMQANNLYSDFIYKGQRLCVPPGGVAAPPSGPSGYYTVCPGDTLAAIAWRFGVSQAAIMQANNLANPSFIYVGQRLLIPGAYAPTPASAAPAPPPEYQPPEDAAVTTTSTLPRSSEPVVIRTEPKWTGSQTSHDPDPDEITTLLVMTHDAEDLDVMIKSSDGFVARGVTAVRYEFSWIPTFAFQDIPGGDYEVWVDGQPSTVVKANLDPGHRALVELRWKQISTDLVVSPSGWVGEVVDNTSGIEPIGVASILVIRTGAIGNKIRVTEPGGFEGICITGTKREHGRGACNMGGLNAGTYLVILDGADIAVEVYLDGVGTATIEFRPA